MRSESRGNAVVILSRPTLPGNVSGRSPGRHAKGEQKSHRERIIESATDLFFERGYEKTNTEKIAQRAKISKREVYLHFADKREILAAVITEVQSEMQSRMDADWSSTDEIKEVLIKAATAIQRFILSERFGKLVRILAAVSYHDPAMVAQFFDMGPNQGRLATARYLKEQMKSGKLRRADHLKAADDFLDLVIGARLMTAVILGYVDSGRHKRINVKHAVEVFLAIYAPKP
jgi:TetR/AcrR family transcriptional regulator, mexJK operon transcriptional repressor